MFKHTPNPPLIQKPNRFHPRPHANPAQCSSSPPDMDTESLLANACESLASASVMVSDFANLLEGPNRNTMLGIQQVIMLGELAVNRALDNIDPRE